MKNLYLTLMLAVGMIFCMASCDEGKGPEGGTAGKYVDYSGGRINLVLPDAKTVEADADGVSIAIKSVDASNVVFECRPGANVGSYWVDVIPLSLLYNTLINEGKVDASRIEVEDIISTLLTSSASSNGVVFSENNLEDFYSHTFDWMNSTYSNGSILTDCDYVICVAPCFDEEGLETANVNLCWFKTPARELVGDPDVRIDVDIKYRSFTAVHDPNDDCKYICYWSYITEEIDAYVDIVGDRMLRDFVRTASAVYDVANVADMSYGVDFGQDASSEISQTSLAVALDVNGTPAEYVARRDFSLKQIPDSPEAVYTVTPYRSAASIFWYKVDFEPTCSYCCLRWMPESEADVIRSYSEDQKAAYVRELVSSTGGWGVSNPKFSFDAAANVPTGDAASVIEQQIVAYHPAEKYVILSAGVNYYGEPTGLQFSEPIVMKQRVTDRPADCLAKNEDFCLTLDNASRTGFRYNVEFKNPDNIALVYFQYVSPVEIDEELQKENPYMFPPEDTYNATRQEWMTYFFESYREAPDGTRSLDVNVWSAEPEDDLDTPQFKRLTHFGYEPGTEYIVAYCAEDFNGVISDVRFATVTTQAAVPGPDPKAEISADLVDGEWLFTFSANDDTGTMLYMTSSYGDANYDLLGLSYILNDPYEDYPTYASLHDVWDEKIMNLGLSTKSLTTYATEQTRTDKSVILALCLPVGADAEGKPVYGDLKHLLIVDGQIKKLEDYRTK